MIKTRRPVLDRTFVAAVGSGLLLALAFPRPSFAFLAWFALVPLLLTMEKRPFRNGFLAGVAFFGLVLYWLNIVMTTYGRMHPVFSVVAYLLLVAYLSLFFGVATWAATRLRQKRGLSFALTLPVLWVGLEFLRSFLLSGFPWALLGYSQGNHLALIQSADLFGVYGVSFLIVLVNAALAGGARAALDRDRQAVPRIALASALLLFAGNIAYGTWRLGQDVDFREKRLQVGLVQGNIDQSIKWDPAFQEMTVERYRELSLRVGTGADLVIWPESATPFYLQDGGPLADIVLSVPRTTGAYLLVGSPAYEIVNRRPHYLNSAFLLGPGGDTLGRSDKVHLVPFGEYVPFGRFFPFIDKLVVGIGDFSPGTITPLPMNGHRIGVLVCFEGIFPELARDYVRQGSDLLVNITNDAWFGRSSAPWQHLGMTRFRAVENRIWVARAANTGVTAFIAPSGAISSSTALFESAALSGEVGVGAGSALYTKTGDIVPAFFLALSCWWAIALRRRSGHLT